MEQLTVALAAPRLLRHARRALLLIGAAFAWWLLFSGGPAQADGGDSARHAFDPVASLTHTTRATTDTLRATPKRLTDSLTRATGKAPKPVRDVVDTATAALEPTLTRTTGSVADAVDETVMYSTDSVRPTLETVTDALPAPQSTPATQPRKASATTVRHHRPAMPAAAPTVVLPDAPAAFSDVPAGHRATHSDGPGDSRPAAPAAPAAPVVPAGTGAPAGPLAALGGLLLVPPAVRRRRLLGGRRSRRLDPAYTPGCSPD